MINALYLSDKALRPEVVKLTTGSKRKPLYDQIRHYTDGDFTEDHTDNDAMKDYIIYANENGLFIDGMEENIVLRPKLVEDGKPFLAGILYGPILILKRNQKTGEEVTLEEEDVAAIVGVLKERMTINIYREELLERGAQWIN